VGGGGGVWECDEAGESLFDHEVPHGHYGHFEGLQ